MTIGILAKVLLGVIALTFIFFLHRRELEDRKTKDYSEMVRLNKLDADTLIKIKERDEYLENQRREALAEYRRSEAGRKSNKSKDETILNHSNGLKLFAISQLLSDDDKQSEVNNSDFSDCITRRPYDSGSSSSYSNGSSSDDSDSGSSSSGGWSDSD